MAAELAVKSRGAIVGTEAARSLLELDAGPHNRLPTTWVVPLGIPVLPDPPSPSSPLPDEGEPVVVALADVSQEAWLPGLRDAVAILEETSPVHLHVLADVTDAETRYSWLRRATCAVHLGEDRSGVASVAVTEALAAGVPVLTTLAACAELPAGTVRLLPADVNARELTGELRHLLAEPAEQARLRLAAGAYARSWTYDDVVESVLEIARQDGAVSGR